MAQPQKVPSYRLHRPSGRAVVTLAGHDHYLGVHGTPESRALYDRLVAEWLAGGRLSPREAASGPTVAEALDAYWGHAQAYYVKDGEPTSQQDRVERSLGAARRLYGGSPARDFGPQRLKAVRAWMVAQGWCRRLVNQRIDCVRLAWKWCVAEEMVPPGAHHALMAVERLKAGRTEAPDHAPVAPAPAAAVAAALGRMPPVLASCARFQLLTAARPGEALQLRPSLLDRTGAVWLYRPASWKTQHRKRPRVLFVGPAAQAAVAPWLAIAEKGGGDAHVFCPAVSVALFRQSQRAARKTPVQPSQEDRSKASPRRKPGTRYAPRAYARAVERACVAAGVEHWHPHQLRHNAATSLVEQGFSWEVVRIVLGHSSVCMTREYAEEEMTKAIACAARSG